MGTDHLESRALVCRVPEATKDNVLKKEALLLKDCFEYLSYTLYKTKERQFSIIFKIIQIPRNGVLSISLDSLHSAIRVTMTVVIIMHSLLAKSIAMGLM